MRVEPVSRPAPLAIAALVLCCVIGVVNGQCSGSGHFAVEDPSTLASCTSLTGYQFLVFGGSGVTDVTFRFPLLQTVSVTNFIVSNTSNTVLNGTYMFPAMPNPTSWPAVTLVISDLPFLTSIVAMPFVELAALSFGSMPRLQSIIGFDRLSTVGNLLVGPLLPALTEYWPLWNISGAVSNFYWTDTGLVSQSSDAFGRITSIGAFQLGGNLQLISYGGFAAVTSMTSLDEGTYAGFGNAGNVRLRSFLAFPNLRTISGSGRIAFGGSGIVELTAFNCTDVFAFRLFNTSLTAFNSTSLRITELFIAQNKYLKSIYLVTTTVRTILTVSLNPVLDTFLAPKQVGNAGLSFVFSDLPALRALPSFSNLFGLSGGLTITRTGIRALVPSDFPAVNLLGPSYITDNPDLVKIDSFNTLTSVTMSIINNPRLTNISGWVNAHSTLGLVVRGNVRLVSAFAESCAINSVIAGPITIQNNTELLQLFCPNRAYPPSTTVYTPITIDAPKLCCAAVQYTWINATFAVGGSLTIAAPCAAACSPNYCACVPPQLVPGSMRSVSAGDSVVSPIQLNSTDIQQFTVQVYSPSDIMQYLVFGFGPTDAPGSLVVTSAVAISPVVAATWTVRLTLASAFGTDLHLAITNQQVPTFTPMPDSFSFPAPVILNGTSVLVGSFSPPRSFVNIQSASTLNLVQFGMLNSAADPRLRVSYGPPGDTNRFVCTPNLPLTTSSTVVCALQLGSTGVGNIFSVTTARGGVAPVNGTDYVNFLAPTITGFTGCDTLLGCPTNGGTRVTVHGTNFVAPIVVTTGSTLCLPPVTLLSPYAVACTLAAGTGQSLSIVVSTDGVFSSPAPLLTYSAPQLFGLKGCVDVTPLVTIDCPRSGARLTLTGSDFGPSGAVVYIGALVCVPVFQNSSLIICQSGPGNTRDSAVSVIQTTGVGTQSTSASVSFVLCQPGTYNLQPPNQYTCANCSVGTFSNVAGVSSCSACLPGAFAGANGTVTCESCPFGSSYAATGASACNTCQPGEYQDVIGQPACKLCPAGKFSTVAGSETCTPCPFGTSQPGDGRTRCDACGVGTFSDSPAGVASCSKCPALTMAPYTGVSACFQCPASSTSSFSREKCDCGVGFYGTTEDQYMECVSCPTGAICQSTGLQVSQLVASNGWWRASNATDEFVQCLQLANCVDGGCAAHRTGPLCALCVDGYQVSATSLSCDKCPERNTALGASIGFTLLIIIALIVVFYVVFRASEARQIVSDRRRNAGDAPATAGTPAVIRSSGRTYMKVVRGYTTESRTPPNYTFQIKLLLSYIQMATALLGFVELPWPSYFSQFIGYMAFVNLDFVPWSSVACVATLTFYSRLIVIVFIPLLVIAVLAIVPRCVFAIQDRLDFSDSDTTRFARRNNIKKFRKLIVFALFLMYPAVSSRILSFFICRDVNGVSYLVADFTLECFDSQWFKYLPLALIGVVLYPIGIPALMFGLLFRNRQRLNKPDILMSYSLIYDAYSRDYWYFELFDMVEKLLLTSMLGFLPPRYQCPAGALIVISFLCTLLVLSPYLRKNDDRMSSVVQIHLFLILVIGYTLQTFDFIVGSLVDVLASMVMFAVLAVLLLILGYHFLIYLRKSLRAIQRERMWKEMNERVGMPAGPTAQVQSLNSTSGSGEHNSAEKNTISPRAERDYSLSSDSAYRNNVSPRNVAVGAKMTTGPHGAVAFTFAHRPSESLLTRDGASPSLHGLYPVAPASPPMHGAAGRDSPSVSGHAGSAGVTERGTRAAHARSIDSGSGSGITERGTRATHAGSVDSASGVVATLVAGIADSSGGASAGGGGSVSQNQRRSTSPVMDALSLGPSATDATATVPVPMEALELTSVAVEPASGGDSGDAASGGAEPTNFVANSGAAPPPPPPSDS